MYKLIKQSEGSIVIKGIEFVQYKEMQVDATLFNYIKKTFPNDFKFEDKKEKAQTKKLEEKVDKKPTRGSRRKKAE